MCSVKKMPLSCPNKGHGWKYYSRATAICIAHDMEVPG